jgi:hypothetical protein
MMNFRAHGWAASCLAVLAASCASVETGPQFPAPPSAQTSRELSRFDAVSVRAEFGVPDFVRKEIESELWRYDAKDCTAFFFLYRDGAVMRLRYIETAPRGANDAPDPSCLALVKAKQKPVS